MVDGSGVLVWEFEVQQNRGREQPIVGQEESGRPSVDREEPGLGLGEHCGSEPWPSVARRRIGVHTDRGRGDRVGDGRMQRAFRMVEFVAGTVSEPLVELCHETEHALGRDPLRLGRLVQAQVAAPLNVAKAVESGVSGGDGWRAEGEIRVNRQRDPFSVVQLKATLDALVTRAVEGDIDIQGSAEVRMVVNTDDPDGRSIGIGDASELCERNPLSFTQWHGRIRPRQWALRRNRQHSSARRSSTCWIRSRRYARNRSR